MVVCDRIVLELMAATSSSSNFPEQLSVCAEVITVRFRQNRQQMRDCLNVDTLELYMREQVMLTADDWTHLRRLADKTDTRTTLRTNNLCTFFAVSCYYNLNALLNFPCMVKGGLIWR